MTSGNSPDELSAHGAEGGLAEEGGGELVVLDDVYFGLLEGSSPPVEGRESLLTRHLHGWLTHH